MRLGVLFSGGKDSTYAAWLAKNQGNEIVCLVSIFSENPESFMFHTPNIELTKEQAKVMQIPLVTQETAGEKENELKDLERAIKKAIKKHHIDGIVTGAIKSVYQSSRIDKICDKFKIKCINPLWQMDEIVLLNNMIKNNFKIIITGVFAYPLDKKWLGRQIDKDFIEKFKELKEKFGINPAGEGGEFESFVINCPMFKHELKIKDSEIFGEGNAWKMSLKIK